jgi:addiction module HigA family antidote
MWRSGTTTEGDMKRREPTSPGEILREEFLAPLGMTQRELADHLGCDVKVVNRIVNGRTSVSAEMALRLGAAFRMSPEFWLNAQKAVDLFRAERSVSKLPSPVLKAS